MEATNAPSGSNAVGGSHASAGTAPVPETHATTAQPENTGALLFRLEPGMAIWTWVVFALLLLLLGRFAWKPVLKVLADREALIKNSLDDAAKARAEFEQVSARCKALLADTEKESAQMVQRAKAEAQAKADEIIAQARTESKNIVETARVDVVREKNAALQEIRAETVNLALLAAGKVLEEKLDGDAQKRTAEKFLEQIARN